MTDAGQSLADENLARFGQNWPMLGKCWPMLHEIGQIGQNGPNVRQNRPKLDNIGQCRPNLGKCRSSLTEPLLPEQLFENMNATVRQLVDNSGGRWGRRGKLFGMCCEHLFGKLSGHLSLVAVVGLSNDAAITWALPGRKLKQISVGCHVWGSSKAVPMSDHVDLGRNECAHNSDLDDIPSLLGQLPNPSGERHFAGPTPSDRT